jgi:hypothetical protein
MTTTVNGHGSGIAQNPSPRVDGCTARGRQVLGAIYMLARSESPKPIELVQEHFRRLVASGDLEEATAQTALADLSRNLKQPADSPARLNEQPPMNQSLDAPNARPALRPTIEVIRGQAHSIATEGEAALCKADLPIFQRGGRLVQPVHYEVPAADERTTIVAGLRRVSQPTMIDLLSQSASVLPHKYRLTCLPD